MSTRAIYDEGLQDGIMKAAVIYDKFASAVTAKMFLERAMLRTGEAARWVFSPWRVDVLQLDTLAREALVNAADAALVVVALSVAHQPPEWLTRWLETWADCRRHSAAALAVITGGSSILRTAAAPVVNVLRALAERHLLTFFCSGEAEPAGAFSQERFLKPALQEIITRASKTNSYPHWGLNE